MGSELEASFSTLVTAIATQALIAMGLAKPHDNNSEQMNLPLAKFNIDLLLMLQDKTENNLDEHEKQLIRYIVQDLQAKYVLLREEKK
jgi:hypothetical protein